MIFRKSNKHYIQIIRKDDNDLVDLYEGEITYIRLMKTRNQHIYYVEELGYHSNISFLHDQYSPIKNMESFSSMTIIDENNPFREESFFKYLSKITELIYGTLEAKTSSIDKF
jgi:hypothetical protein